MQGDIKVQVQVDIKVQGDVEVQEQEQHLGNAHGAVWVPDGTHVHGVPQDRRLQVGVSQRFAPFFDFHLLIILFFKLFPPSPTSEAAKMRCTLAAISGPIPSPGIRVTVRGSLGDRGERVTG